MLIKSLEENLRKQLDHRQSHIIAALAFGEVELKIILGADKCMTRPETSKKRKGRRRVGATVNKHCYVYGKHLKIDVSVNYLKTCFCRSICKMTLCREEFFDLVTGKRMN